MCYRFPHTVEQVLRNSGWHPDRIVDVNLLKQWLVIDFPLGNGNLQMRMFSTAWRALCEFGDLNIDQNGPGVSCYRASFVINPLAVRDSGMWNYNWIVDEWLYDGGIFPLGIWGDNENAFAITATGAIINDNSQLLGNNIDEALSNLIMGIMPPTIKIPQEKFHEASNLFPLILSRFGIT